MNCNPRNLVIKVFKDPNIDVISKCILEFVEAYANSRIFQPRNTTSLFLDKGTFTFYDVNVPGEGHKKAYVMPKYQGSLKNVFEIPFASVKMGVSMDYDKHFELINDLLRNAIGNLEICRDVQNDSQSKFIHGDIKLDNILYDSDKSYIHDWDGVYLYGNHLLHINEVPYKRGLFMTPVSTHPMMMLYMNIVNNNDVSETSVLLQKLKSKSNDHLAIWRFLFAATGIANEIKTIFEEVLKKSGYPDGYHETMKAFLESANENTIREWISKQLLHFDLFSMGASIMFYYVLYTKLDNLFSTRFNGLDIDTKRKFEWFTDSIYTIAFNCIKQAIVPLPMQGGYILPRPLSNRKYVNNIMSQYSFSDMKKSGVKDDSRDLKMFIDDIFSKMNDEKKEEVRKSLLIGQNTVFCYSMDNQGSQLINTKQL